FILDETEAVVERKRIKEGPAARDALKDVLVGILNSAGPTDGIHLVDGRLTTVLVVGVNGVGKTTTIGKLINVWKKQGHRPIVAAADTFRAAASDQLKIWADRAGVPVVSHQHGADPGAVVFDAWQAAQSRRADVLVVDTAGRLHTKFNLMEELRKIYRVLAKQDPAAPDATLLVLDATTGQNALTQAKEFTKAAKVTGLILTKIDGTAKGGCVFPIVRELKVPIVYLGSGEQIDDLEPFDARSFVEALLTEKVPR
ncbi:MAG TPA: signal recognition particle-docking protein FtsY, partial [Chloroflexota bacterium]|nr:signal recognition particle-docking protein FtsY [Chloroflexota bacterium]